MKGDAELKTFEALTQLMDVPADSMSDEEVVAMAQRDLEDSRMTPMQAEKKEYTVRLEPCTVCLHDPAFGVIHTGCPQCKRDVKLLPEPPRLVRVSDDPIAYGVPE